MSTFTRARYTPALLEARALPAEVGMDHDYSRYITIRTDNSRYTAISTIGALDLVLGKDLTLHLLRIHAGHALGAAAMTLDAYVSQGDELKDIQASLLVNILKEIVQASFAPLTEQEIICRRTIEGLRSGCSAKHRLKAHP